MTDGTHQHAGEHDGGEGQLMPVKVAPASAVPDPPRMTPDELRVVAEEGRRWHEDFQRRTRPMECLDAADLAVTVR